MTQSNGWDLQHLKSKKYCVILYNAQDNIINQPFAIGLRDCIRTSYSPYSVKNQATFVLFVTILLLRSTSHLFFHHHRPFFNIFLTCSESISNYSATSFARNNGFSKVPQTLNCKRLDYFEPKQQLQPRVEMELLSPLSLNPLPFLT